jgi:hypothetical protein
VDEIDQHLAGRSVAAVPVPHDCIDGLLAAYWRRPRAYLDPRARASISAFAQFDAAAVARGLGQLERDLDAGQWERRFGHLHELTTLDVCYRLLAARR